MTIVSLPLIRTPLLLDQGPTFMSFHLTLIASQRALSPNTVTLGFRVSTYDFSGGIHNSVHFKPLAWGQLCDRH